MATITFRVFGFECSSSETLCGHFEEFSTCTVLGASASSTTSIGSGVSSSSPRVLTKSRYS